MYWVVIKDNRNDYLTELLTGTEAFATNNFF